MAWFKWTTNWSSGYGKTFQWKEIDDDSYRKDDGTWDTDQIIEDYQLHNEGNWSEHYRGITCEVVDKPPREVLDEKIAEAENLVNYWTKRLEELRGQLDEAEDG